MSFYNSGEDSNKNFVIKVNMKQGAINITVYRWAGVWGPFKVKIPCGECSLTKDIINDTIAKELQGLPVEFKLYDWLSKWWEPLKVGGWHAPIVMVEGKVISQGKALNRGLLTQAVIEAYAKKFQVKGNVIFGKTGCPHCQRAKGYLETAAIDYDYYDVIENPRALYEMLARVKPIIGPKTPVTVPQIWIDGKYIGGADQLSEIVKQQVEPNYERGKCSISPDN